MRSTAHFKSHPIHPMLIPFPIAFLGGSFVADAAALALGSAQLATFGAYLAIAGIVMGLLAAIPGVIDYLFTVPPKSSGKRRASLHGLANVSAVGLFAAVAFLREPIGEPLGVALLLIEAVGVGLLVSGGWMGGTLVFRNQIGVDHRYAGAGKWNEERASKEDGRVVLGRVDELHVDQMKLVHVGGRRIVLARSEEGFAAFDDHCSHRGASLAGGSMICGTVQCPWHGSQFDVRTGAVKAGPAEESIAVYSVEVHEGILSIRL